PQTAAKRKRKSSYMTPDSQFTNKLTAAGTVSKIAIVPAAIMENTNQDRECKSVGVEVSAGELIAVCLGSENSTVGSEREPVADQKTSVSELIALVERLKSKYPGVERIGVAVPGLIRRETSRVDYSSRIASHVGIDIADELRS